MRSGQEDSEENRPNFCPSNFCNILGAFQDCFDYYLGEGKVHTNTSSIVAFKLVPFFVIITIINFFHSLGIVWDSQDFCINGSSSSAGAATKRLLTVQGSPPTVERQVDISGRC